MNQRGFTMMEFVLIVSISAILVVGMGVVVEMPRQMVEQQQGEATASHALVSIDQLDKDIRFAADVVVPDPKRLEVYPKGAPMLEYAWDGIAGGALTRTDAGGPVTLLESVQSLSFTVETATIDADPQEADVTSTAVEGAAWDAFNFEPGYSIGSKGKYAVTVTPNRSPVGATDFAGYYFVSQSLGGDTALPTLLTARLVRTGAADLTVALYAADPTSRAPIPSQKIASATVQNSQLPTAMSDLAIPLTATHSLQEGEAYIVVLMGGDGGLMSCDVEHHVLSKPRAAGASTTSFMAGSPSSWWQATGHQDEDASQAPFALLATVDAVVDGTGGATTVTVPVNVKLDVTLVDQNGTQQLKTSFPIENNLCLVNQ